jgi:hypothetical protein
LAPTLHRHTNPQKLESQAGMVREAADCRLAGRLGRSEYAQRFAEKRMISLSQKFTNLAPSRLHKRTVPQKPHHEESESSTGKRIVLASLDG